MSDADLCSIPSVQNTQRTEYVRGNCYIGAMDHYFFVLKRKSSKCQTSFDLTTFIILLLLLLITAKIRALTFVLISIITHPYRHYSSY